MKKRSSKAIMTGIILILTLSVMTLLSGCGDPTLEDYVNEHDDVKATLEASGKAVTTDELSTKVTVEDNTLVYTYQYSSNFEDAVKEKMADYIKESLDSVASTYEGIAADWEKETKIKDISVRLVYLSKDGSEICRKDFR